MFKQPKNIVYGIHAVKEAIDAEKSIEKILVKTGTLHERVKELVAYARSRNIPVQYVPDEKLTALCRDDKHQGVMAQIAQVEYQSVEQVLTDVMDRGETPLFVMLDGVTDVRNFGAIARVAECMGAHAVIVPAKGTAAANGEAMKASAGALHHLPVCRENNLVDVVLLLQSYGIQTVASTEKAHDSLYEIDFTQPICIVLGSEDKGINNALLRRLDRMAKIPMRGQVSSLNVSVAAGIMLAEACRQRS